MNDKSQRLARIASRMLVDRGITSAASPRAAAALQTIDSERVSSAPGIVRAFQERVQAVSKDRELSEEGRRTRIRAAAESAIGNIAAIARQIVTLEAEHRQDRDSAVPLPKPDAADALVDLALAQHVRDAAPIKARLLATSERVRLAVARIPAELSGITPEVLAEVHGSLMSPEKAAQLGAEADALGAARHVIQSAIDEIAPVARLAPLDAVKHFGSTWRLPGVASAAVVERMAAEAGEG